LNDRSTSRHEEERHYEAYRTERPQDEEAIGAAQWEWIQKQIPGQGGGHRLSVLDVGCGHGGFLCAARRAGCRVAGIELDPPSVESCWKQGLHVVQGSVFDVEMPQGPWDVITIWDVLEHLEYPSKALSLVTELLACGGFMVLRGRNVRLHGPVKVIYARSVRSMRRLHIPDVSCVHRWGFHPAGYRILLRRAGLDDVRLYAGVPTPGDRSGALGPRWIAHSIKRTLRGTAATLQRISFGRCYAFPSVLISARKCPAEIASSSPEGMASGSTLLSSAVSPKP
jgi:SAM-dependent methyltransferase